MSVETVRRILHERGISWQATKTWKTSTDPDFTSKKTSFAAGSKIRHPDYPFKAA